MSYDKMFNDLILHVVSDYVLIASKFKSVAIHYYHVILLVKDGICNHIHRINLQSSAYIDVHGTNTEDPTKHEPKPHCSTGH